MGKDVAEVHEVMSDAVEGMRLVAKDVIMRQGKFEEVVVECRRQEVRVGAGVREHGSE